MQCSSSLARHDSESGIVLLAVIFMTVVLLISLAVAAPKIALSLQRQKDLETIHRGEQYRRAIQLYYRQFGRYPTSIDQLVNTNNVRFLRKRYTDPLTGKDDWKPVYYGQAHVRPLGFFGKPLSAVGAAGVASVVMGGSSQGMYAIVPSPTTGSMSGSDSSGAATSSSDDALGGNSDRSGAFGSSSSDAFSVGGQSTNGTGIGTTLGSTSSIGGTSTLSASSSSTPGSSNTPFGSSNGTSATAFGGGGPIVGFTLPVDKPSVIAYMKQTRYNKWEFNYDPIVDQLQAVSLLGGSGAAASGMDSGNNSVFGNSGTGTQGNSLGGSSAGSDSSSSSPSGIGSSSDSPLGSSPTNDFGSTPQE